MRLKTFRAVRYAGAAGDPGELLAPPYDVIDADEARELRGRSPFNAVRLVLPGGDAPERYGTAARRLRDWLADGLLARDDDPALWVYGQTFRHAGREVTRHGVFGALELSAFGRGEVVPHEETHRGPKEDRLALMRACGAQLSPVFLVAPDPGPRLPALVDRAVKGAPVLDARTPDGMRHRLWRVVEGPLAEQIRSVVGGAPLLIADGHHRYETALEMARGTPEGHPARRTLACVVGRSDPGLLCLPTHRALARPPSAGGAGGHRPGPSDAPGPGEGADPWRRLLEEGFEVRPLGTADPGEAAGAAADAGGGALAMVGGGGREALLLGPRPSPAEASGDAATPPAPVIFDRRVLRAGFDAGPEEAVESGLLSYHRDAGEALRAAGDDGAAFLLPPPDVDAVWETAVAGGRLPPKSTYFWPKLPSGLLFRLLEP